MSTKPTQRPNVIYVLGLGRSGTTLITSILNQHQKVVGVGELNKIGVLFNTAECSCGALLPDCEFWNAVSQRVKREVGIDLTQVSDVFRGQERKHNFFNPFKPTSKIYKDVNTALFNGILEESGAEIVVDSSKNVMRFYSIRKLANIKTLTFVRNPFGVCNSLRKIYSETPGKNKILIYSLLSYTFNNLFLALRSKFKKHMLLFKYESIGERHKSLAFWQSLGVDDQFQTTKSYHVGYGNNLIKSFDYSSFKFKEDVSYKTELPTFWKFMVVALCWPVMLIFGYSIFK